MSRLFTAALALLLAGNLVLPPRWCCVMAAPDVESAAAASCSTAGCPHCKQSPERKSRSLPCRDSSGECCIGKPAVAPSHDTPLPIDLAAGPAWIMADAMLAIAVVPATVVAAFESPPARVLQCVWRC